MTALLYFTLVGMTYKIPTTFFTDLLYNTQTKINEWDLVQLLLGFYKKTAAEDVTYMDLKNLTQLILPLSFQLIGIVFSIRFLTIPLSYHVFIKPRIQNKGHYYSFFIKEIVINAFTYAIILAFSLVTVINLSTLTSSESSFNYQKGNVGLSLVLYTVMLVMMILTASIFIFIGYLKNRSVFFIFLTILFLFLINTFDRIATSVNLILFDRSHYFFDSFFFWGILLIIEALFLTHIDLRQEEYND